MTWNCSELLASVATNTVRVARAWGRYAELFGYDDKTGILSTIRAE